MKPNKSYWTLEEVAKLRQHLTDALLLADHLSEPDDLDYISPELEGATNEIDSLILLAEQRGWKP